MGLISRWIESRGIPTVSIYLQSGMCDAVPAPRMVLLRWPFGHPFGEPNRPDLQAMVLRRVLHWSAQAREFGQCAEPGWRWRRTEVDLPTSWHEVLSPPSPE